MTRYRKEHDDLVRAAVPPTGSTAVEIVKATGLSLRRVRRILLRLESDRRVQRLQISDDAHVWMPLPDPNAEADR